MNTGCIKTISHKPSEEQIVQIQEKIVKITYDVPEELMRECQWLSPLKDNTRQARVQAITTNIERQVECYHLNNAKLEFLKALRQHNNGR